MPRPVLIALILSVAAFTPAAVAQTAFVQPTPQELSMTSLPGYPGVAAVVLNKEEITRDDMHSATYYARIKILAEDGKKYANVEIAYTSVSGDWNNNSVDDVQGRTIHPDGTIIPFTGKPYEEVIEKGKDYRYQAKVFTLPDVTVGSIIEYRYITHINYRWYSAPRWIIQDDLYVKTAHYIWYPSTDTIFDEVGSTAHSIFYFPLLPNGAHVQHKGQSYELTINDVPPVVEEEYMPPLGNYSYRVYFNCTAENTQDDYWKNHGKYWSKRTNDFINPNSDLKSSTQQIIAGATTQDQKLRAIYAAVMSLENTDFTREHNQREDKANGVAKLNTVDDVLKRRRGDSWELTELFIGMARAAGMNADAVAVADRSRDIFIPQWLNLHQFDALLAVVNVDGKDQFFDPGERYAPYGHLAWQHTSVKGLRQKGNEAIFADTPGDTYTANLITRVASLKMDATGQITGRIDVTYIGAAALRIRQDALRGDDENLKHQLRTSLESIIPHTLEVGEVTVSNIADYENPLKVSYNVEGTAGTWTGKRLVLPADLFFLNERATFPHEKRDVAVDFNYPRQVKDAVRIVFPANFTVEAAPAAAKYTLSNFAGYAMSVEPSTSYFTTRREYDFGQVFVLPEDYRQLRNFYSQFETNDQQSVILKSTTAATTTASNTPAAN